MPYASSGPRAGTLDLRSVALDLVDALASDAEEPILLIMLELGACKPRMGPASSAPTDTRAGSQFRAALAGFLVPALLCSAWLALAPRASAAGDLDVGFADYLYGDTIPKKRNRWIDRTVAANASIVRVNVYWSSVATSEPADPRNPGDPAYNFTTIDNAVRAAEDRGLDILLTSFNAPPWAEGTGRRTGARPGTWKPEPAAYGDFAHALAVRYSGGFPSGSSAPLPAVEYFQAWNEPNLITYIEPQWEGKKNMSSEIYVSLLNKFYDEVKAVDPQAKIVSAGTAPHGDPRGGPNRTRPLHFLREVLCLNGKNEKGRCTQAGKAKADIFAHHPINRNDSPRTRAEFEGDIKIADVHSLIKTIRKAEKLHTIGTPGRHQLWADEVWWQTNPPNRREGVRPSSQARWVAEGLYLLWKQGVSKVIFLQFRDAKYRPGLPKAANYQTGVYTYAGKKKPSYKAVKFPFVTERKGKESRLRAWGIAPKSGRLTIEAKSKRGGYETVDTVKAKKGKVFTERLDLKRHKVSRCSSTLQRRCAWLRASIGRQTSLVWIQKNG